jgi:DNA polymerase-1
MKETKNKQLVIDGDMLLYKAASVAEQEIRWSDDIWTLETNMNVAKAEADRQVDEIKRDLKSDDILVVFSDRVTFRHKMWPAYKQNRSGKRKPLGLGELKEWMMESYTSTLYPNLEADDAIGIIVTEDTDNRVAVSGDKDFGTLPITWYNHLKKTLRTITVGEANYFHLIQSLMGDMTDGFAGCKGFGQITADKWLKKHGAYWESVVDAYKSKDQTAEDALMNARLARILRAGEYDRDTHEVKLWEPKVNAKAQSQQIPFKC